MSPITVRHQLRLANELFNNDIHLVGTLKTNRAKLLEIT